MGRVRRASALVSASVAASAAGQLLPGEVLVVYDSRSADSLAVAEFYAGSALVPGGTGTEPGVHRGLRVFNLQTSGAAPATNNTLAYADFAARLRDPIRAHLASSGLDRSIRCMVLTKGLAHRVRDTTAAGAGDVPNQAANQFNAGDATYCSTDSELTLLWQNLDSGEAGGAGDSRSDGCWVNPYWREMRPMSRFGTDFRHEGKTLGHLAGAGQIWGNSTSSVPEPQRLRAGDIFLVCRLDGHTVADVRAAVQRAQNLTFQTATGVFVLDESGSNGIADAAPNNEFDNHDAPTRFGDDYEQTRDLILADGRFGTVAQPAQVQYNAAAGDADFIVGPNIAFTGGLIVPGPVVLLTSYGRNHTGRPNRVSDNEDAGLLYAESFNYAPGAIFNTMESFNGRDLGGLGIGTVEQEQIADFIATGGTFGIGNVWEPFTFAVGDSRWLASSFVLGGLSWAEAAYTALPCLSWQQIVLGDPLARVKVRRVEDLNNDGRVDAEDLHAFERTPTDLNRSGAADDTDRKLLVASIRGFDLDQGMKRR